MEGPGIKPPKPGPQKHRAGSIRRAIILLRGQKVILDRDLAVLYGVPTRR